MIGAIIGDIAGSKYEFNNIKHTNFDLFDQGCKFTDDTVCTLAIAKALLDCKGDYIDLQQRVIDNFRQLCIRHQSCGFGRRFMKWLKEGSLQPYESFGNGAAMRVSPVSYVAENIDQVKALSYKVTSITHNSEQGLKAAECVAICIFMANRGFSKTEIKKYVQENYYNLDFDIETLRQTYTFDVSCENSVPQAIYCFLKGKSFDQTIKLAISIGGDSDTIACIAGSIAQGYYGVPNFTKARAIGYLTDDLKSIYDEFVQKFNVVD